MPTKIFVTGATGYIGGDALYELVEKHPEYEITCLVRNSDKGAKIASQYAKLRLVYGTLDDSEILENEAEKADIILNFANADHVGGATALVHGMTRRSDKGPGYLIHTSGTGILVSINAGAIGYGKPDEKVFNDWDGVAEVTSLPDAAAHRNVDRVILAAGTQKDTKVETAIVCPPLIYGRGRGPDNQKSIQLPELAKAVLKGKKGIQIGAGKNVWNIVHVVDLSKVYVKLVEAAAAKGGNVSWGADGYYFAENGEHVWEDIYKGVAVSSHKAGYIPSDEVVSISADEADQLSPHAKYLWGTNSRCRAVRARKILGWRPVEGSIEDEIPVAIEIEAKSLGLVEGHAAKVAS